MTPNAEAGGPPAESYGQLFLRFLRFGFLAWGGPVAQIAMIKQELVEEEHWISREQFNRVLAVYQVLPGPEAHELCVYFGMVARGRIGAVLAGLGFMLPGFVLMFLLSWAYVRFGLASPIIPAIFFGFKPAVAALTVRAVQRIGQHALKNRWLWGIAVAAGLATVLQVNFLITLALAGLVYGGITGGVGRGASGSRRVAVRSRSSATNCCGRTEHRRAVWVRAAYRLTHVRWSLHSHPVLAARCG